MILDDFKVIPVVVLNNELEAKEKLQGLVDGNLLVAEITFRTSYAYEGIKYAIKHFPNLTIGAGTVINQNQCLQAIEAGCKFIVSPGFSKEVSDVCKNHQIQYFPGCATPTEIMMALQEGWEIIKFFPAQIYGGLKAIDALGASFPQIKYIPTGGVNSDNLTDYLSHPKIFAVGGSWMMKGDIKNNCLEINKIIKTIK